MMRRLKIVSDGTAYKTHVYVVDDEGNTLHELDMVDDVTWRCNARSGESSATIEVGFVQVELVGDPPDELNLCAYERISGRCDAPRSAHNVMAHPFVERES